MENFLVSAGVVLALLDADNPFHKKALDTLREMRDQNVIPLLTNFVVSEIFFLLTSVLGPDAGRTWLRHNIWPVERVTEVDEERAKAIILSGADNKDSKELSYTDATTMAVMERLGIRRILTSDL